MREKPHVQEVFQMAEFKYCRNCGKQLQPGETVCLGCGVPVGKGHDYCWNCGGKTDPEAVVCITCGVGLIPKSGQPGQAQACAPRVGKSKIAAGILGIFLGWLGIHNFYLGFQSKAIVQLVLGLLGIVTFGITTWISAIWGLVEGIMILVGSIPADADGKPLAD
jgi:TM2 domain-containing membrane protein YozV